MRYIVTPLHRFLFPSVVWQTNAPSVHLTFDDGPHPIATPRVLKILDTYNIRSDFFLVGRAVEANPQLAKEIHAAGHHLGNHSYDHRKMLFWSHAEIRSEMEKANEVVSDIAGGTVAHFRPPFGYFDYRTIRIARELGKKIIMWSIDPGDFELISSRVLVARIMKRLRPGAIILLHDNDFTAEKLADFLPRVIDSITHAGLTISPLPV